MRTVEFEADLSKKGSLDIPPEVAAELPIPSHARVILILGEAEDDRDWRLVNVGDRTRYIVNGWLPERPYAESDNDPPSVVTVPETTDD